MLNKTILMGRLGRNPEKRYTQNGTPVASFSLAVDRDFKDKASGERITDWIDVVAWRQTAEFVCKYFSKGRLAVVEGRLQSRTYTDREGVKRKAVELVADNVYFADSKTVFPPPPEENADERSLPPQPTNDYNEMDEEGELPF